MKLRNTLILLFIVLILFVFVYFTELRKPGEISGKSKELGRILEIEKNNVIKIELAFADTGSTIYSMGSNGQWQMEKPEKAKADGLVVDNIISRIIGKNVQSILKDQTNTVEYGLDKPRVTAIFHLKDGSDKVLLLGNPVPTGNYIYLQERSKSDIFLVPANIIDELIKERK